MKKVLLYFLCAVISGAGSAFAAKADPDEEKKGAVELESRGAVPKGAVVLRSGLAWMSEDSPALAPLFYQMRANLQDKGYTVIKTAPSKTLPPPETPMPDLNLQEQPAKTPKKKAAPAQSEQAVQERAAELAKEGKLPQLKLRGYGNPDDPIPDSIRQIAPPDAQAMLHAYSQIKGLPVLRGANSAPPRYLPAELADIDPRQADYAIVLRIALLVGSGGYSEAGREAVNEASLGFTAIPAAANRPYYDTPGGWERGYGGTSPNDRDPWGRDNDFKARNYLKKDERYAAPPGQTPSAEQFGGPSPLPLPGYGGRDGMPGYFYLVELEGYDLIPLRNNKNLKPERLWHAAARQPSGKPDLRAAAPTLLRMLLEHIEGQTVRR